VLGIHTQTDTSRLGNCPKQRVLLEKLQGEQRRRMAAWVGFTNSHTLRAARSGLGTDPDRLEAGVGAPGRDRLGRYDPEDQLTLVAEAGGTIGT
jgi:hypothetical protein